MKQAGRRGPDTHGYTVRHFCESLEFFCKRFLLENEFIIGSSGCIDFTIVIGVKSLKGPDQLCLIRLKTERNADDNIKSGMVNLAGCSERTSLG
jgi:hypothetical protein